MYIIYYSYYVKYDKHFVHFSYMYTIHVVHLIKHTLYIYIYISFLFYKAIKIQYKVINI